MDPRLQAWAQSVGLQRIAYLMQSRQYEGAISHITNALRSIPVHVPHLFVTLILDRAECFWQLNHLDHFLSDFFDYIKNCGGHERNLGLSQRKEYFVRWLSQSDVLLEHWQAARFFESCLQILPYNSKEQAQCFILLGIQKSFTSDQNNGLPLIERGKLSSSKAFEEFLSHWKKTGITAMKDHDYPKAKTFLQRALALLISHKNPDQTRRSILSHLANVHFHLKEYDQALEAGNQLLTEGGHSMEEAKRWKERGKKLFQEKNYEVVLKVYSLAINFSPRLDDSHPEHNELRSMLLSNRCTAYCKLQTFDKALEDADLCVRVNPTWSKGHYRLGSTLVGLQRYKEGCHAFCQAFMHADDESDKRDIFQQILVAAVKVPVGLEDIPLDVPKPLVQDFVNRSVQSKDWEKLGFLYLGGSCRYKYGQGGVATSCDASGVPLELILDGDIKNVDLPKLVGALIEAGAPHMGSPGCTESPLSIATRKKAKGVLDVLSRYDKSQIIACFEKGVTAFDDQEYGKCITLLQNAIQGMLDSDQQKIAYNLLCDAYFATEEYRKGVECAWKAHHIQGSEEDLIQVDLFAEKWKKRGNDLLSLKHYDLMVDCYTLALLKSPADSVDLRAALHSNRSMAYLNRKMMKEAKDDARRCIQLKKAWFRGYSRLAACWEEEGKLQEAINEYCRGLLAVKTENELSSLCDDIVALSMRCLGDDITIPAVIPAKAINGIVKQAVKDQNVNKLRHLYVLKRCQRPGSKELHCLGDLADCIAQTVPLDMVLMADVQDKDVLVKELLSRDASPHGLHDTDSLEKPIHIAIKQQNYTVSAMLLQYGADPRTILIKGLEPFDPQAPHFSQWLSLGREALRYKRFSRAELFFSMALVYPDAAKDPSARCVAFKALSDIAYEEKGYQDCLLKGRQAFHFSPTKSEAEARKWQERGKTLASKDSCSDLVPDYFTLAMNYAEPSDEKLRFELLCQRSSAYREIKDIQQAIEDGRNATSIRPGNIQGPNCLLSCYEILGNQSKTFSALVQCLKTDVSPTEKQQFLKKALDLAVDLPGGTTAITIELPEQLIRQIHEEAIFSANWELLRLLYLGGGGPAKHEIRKGGLATGRISAERVPIEDVVSASFPFKPETISVLLDHGARVEGLRGNASPLLYCTTKKETELMKVLLDHGANPCVKTDDKTLLHREVVTAINTGNLKILQVLFDSAHPDIENVRDSEGSSLYHYAMRGKINDKRCNVLKCLMNAKVNPDIPDKYGKRPCDCCSKGDDRYKMLAKFMKEFIPKPVEESNHPKPRGKSERIAPPPLLEGHKDAPNKDKVTDGVAEEKNLDDSQPSKSKSEIAKKKKEDKRTRLSYLIQNMVFEKPDVSAQQNVEDETQENVENEEGLVTASVLEEQDIALEEFKDDEGVLSSQGEKDEKAEEMEECETNEQKSLFENLTWEVDCTENVWKTLKSKRVSEKMKRKIIEKIRMLAEGRWNKKLCKRLEGEPKKTGILLYESKLTKSARIIWEKTIAFSARCSNDPKLRLSVESDQGLIYSDIIRVWDIVLDHGDLDHRIQNVCKSHDRGSHCIIKASLKGMKKQESNNKLSLPSYYKDRKSSGSDQCPVNESNGTFYPPASSTENEYHILKFYSFTSALVDTLLDDKQNTKIDFPFKVTELEHAIINLKQDKRCTIILLGRSGTGKTTCCLYRLWTEFQSYWEKAINAGPHIPKYAIANDEQDESSVHETKKPIPVETGAECDSEVKVWPVESAHKERVGPSQIISVSDLPRGTYDETDELQDENPLKDFEHFHQMFITKNKVLCSEVQKNFKDLKNACPATKGITNTDDSLPSRIQDIDENAWPLFIGARDWLILLDASLPGDPFFKRKKDGSLLDEIEGWGQEDTHLHFIPEDEDEEDEFDEEMDHQPNSTERVKKQAAKSTRVGSNKREVTYQVFIHELWPKMKKSVKNDYHPTLVWTEIRSFIKGSAEALQTDTGFLEIDEYDQLGRKRAPTFMGDRSTVHQLFVIYQNIIRSSRTLFDEADLVYNLHQRLMKNREIEWSIHNIYVDETQDFTQAELSLLIHCCRFPNRMFFTGDTAQSIMRGIAFRFEDLKTLFYGIKTSSGLSPSEDPIRVPDRLYHLTYNYRSHAGILRLASSIVDLMLKLFPESFDKLDKDLGLFEGPKPVLLESCSLSDLAMILRGNKRHASRIEFGAHQAVLVVNEEARNSMPDELKYGLVLTIYEAKGLEFDDVLIYNFFKDSHARKEWRVVIDYIEKHQEEAYSAVTGLREIKEEDLQLKTRPLEFDPEKHKVLNSELKFLYTAITRARVNVWFFDEDEENRTPMFEYFQRLDLVRAITIDTQDEGNTTTLNSMFAEGSTKSEWKKQGEFFYKKGLWQVAETCFTLGDDDLMIRKCQAQKQANEASKNRGNPQNMKEMFCDAAAQFLELEMATEAEVCLFNAREKLLLAELYRKMEKFREASKLFRSERHYKDASQCMEQINNYRQAVEIFCDATLYQDAIDVLERFKSLKIDQATAKDQGVIPPKPNRTIEGLCYKLAKTYLNEGKTEEMETILQRLSPNDRISFFKKNGCIEEAARALVEVGSNEDAAHFLQLNGRFREAVKYSEDPKFVADCYLSEARRSLVKSENSGKIDELLDEALKYYRRGGDQNGEGEVRLLIGRRQNNIDDIESSGKIFDSTLNVCGEAEVTEEFLKRDVDQFCYKIRVETIERLFDLIINLHKPYTKLNAVQLKMISLCEQFFGLTRPQDPTMRQYRTKTHERYHQIVPNTTAKLEEIIYTKEAYNEIVRYLFKKAVDLVGKTTQFLKSKLKWETGQLSRDKTTFEVLFNWVYLDAIAAKFCNDLKPFPESTISAPTKDLLPERNEDKFYLCRLLLKLVFPDAGPSNIQLSREEIQRVRSNNAVKMRLMEFCGHLCKTLNLKQDYVDTLLLISRLRQLQNMQHLMSDLLREREQSFRTEFNKTMDKRLKFRHGMLPTSSGRFEIFFRYWERGKKKMCVQCDVEQSLHLTTRRFLGYAAKSQTLVYPSIANTTMILEHQITVALVMLARINYRNQGFSALLPQSYLSRLRFTDEITCTKKQHYKTFQAIDQSAKSFQFNLQEEMRYQKKIQSIITRIVELMFGKFSKLFNVFLDTFSSGETTKLIESGVAGRVMVLSLTLLANCGKNLSVDCQTMILSNIFKVVPPSTPDHLKEAFQKLADIRNFSDVVVILTDVLANQNGGRLYEVRWSEPWTKLDKRFVQPINYSRYQLEVDISELRAAAGPAAESSHGVPEERVREAEEEDTESEHGLTSFDDNERQKEEEEQSKRDHAAIKIQKCFKRYQLRRKKDKDNLLPSDIDRRLSSEFKVDSSACTICGVDFSAPFTVDEHVQKNSHQIKEQNFQKYKTFYTTTVDKVISQANSLRDKDTTKDLELDLNELERVSEEVWKTVKNIETSKKWGDIQELKSQVTKLENKVNNIEEMTQKDSNLDETDEIDEAGFIDDDDGDDATELMPFPNTQRKHRGRGKHHGKQRNCRK